MTGVICAKRRRKQQLPNVTFPKTRLDEYDNHIAEKTEMRNLRKVHRDSTEKLIICFDLENIINLSHAGISSSFFKRKFNLYNLTAHSSIRNQGYCAIWIEVMAGREGNDIASTFIAILKKIVQDTLTFTEIFAWSDSCVPQNRNQVISFAIMNFLRGHPHIISITMHYSIPDHSAVQEVDNMHLNSDLTNQVLGTIS